MRVDLRDLREVMVQDYSVRPPQFAPQSYRTTMSEREVIARRPWGWLGFDLGGSRAAKAFTISGGGAVSVTERVWAIPLWPLLLASLVPVARRLWQNRQSQRWLRSGRCKNCGYDLRATPGRCPECGKSARLRLSHNSPLARTVAAGKMLDVRELARGRPSDG